MAEATGGQVSSQVSSQVLIVGAGPTGLTLAIELQRRGVPHRIIEREVELHQQSRATDIQARTLEVFEDLGVIEQALALGKRRSSAAIRSDGELVVRLVFAEADSPYPFALGLMQHETQRLLERRLVELGGRVERGVRLVDLEQDAAGVSATLEHHDGSKTTQRCDWLVGCDGARSPVRHLLEIPFAGSTFAERFFLVDAQLASAWNEDELLVLASPQGMAVVGGIGPGPERFVRVMGDLDPDAPEHEDPDRELDDEACMALIRGRLGEHLQIASLGWRASFRINTRMIDRYREGRVLLAGDAAHIHSPMTGHGMNTGIQDAYNLAWKLALVVQGHAAPSLLDSYGHERHAVAETLLSKTDIQTRVMLSRNRFAHGAIAVLGQLAFRLAAAHQRILASAVELDVGYGDSPIVGERPGSLWDARLFRDPDSEQASIGDQRSFVDGPKPGERAPDLELDDARLFVHLRGVVHNLLLFDGFAPTEDGYRNLAEIAAKTQARWPELVRVHVISLVPDKPSALHSTAQLLHDGDAALHRRYGATAECLYMIRPDGHVGYRSQPASFAAVEAYMHMLLGR